MSKIQKKTLDYRLIEEGYYKEKFIEIAFELVRFSRTGVYQKKTNVNKITII